MPDRRQHQKDIIRAVLVRYNSAAGTSYAISRWPDEEATNRNRRACDAYAEYPGIIPLAMEHTILPTFDQQKDHAARFMKAVGGLEEELKDLFPYRLMLLVPMFAVDKGYEWSQTKELIKGYVLNARASIPKGKREHQIAGVPFAVTLERTDEPPHLFLVGRLLDSAFNVPEELADRMAAALADKDDQLSGYHEVGDRTLLILESQDISLVSPATIYQAFLAACTRITLKHIDQIWLAQTYEPEADYLFIYCLRADQDLMDRVNPPNAQFGPRYAHVRRPKTENDQSCQSEP